MSFGPEQAPPDNWFGELAAHCPTAQHVYVSGGGQIIDGQVEDAITVVTFLQFDRATVHPVLLEGATVDGSEQIGVEVATRLRDISGLRHVLLFAEGITFNGSAFLSGLNPLLPEGVRVSGGMASNGTALSNSVIGLNGPPRTGRVVAVGLAGDSLIVGTGSVGGWDFFGPERVVTRADNTVLHELDGERALDVYKRYLGSFAEELPGSALLFPLAVRATRESPVTVRTCLSVDETDGTLRFAGDIPNGAMVRLMRTTPDKLADGAARAALLARTDAPRNDGQDSLTLCVSCIAAKQLDNDSLIDDVRTALETTGLDPARLMLEITESDVMRESDAALAKLNALKALGVRLAIDDFGTGHSSLSHLQFFPVDELKIDRSFIQRIEEGDREAAFVRTIVSLAKSLSVEVVAEGIEEVGQQRFLHSVGCDIGQGYLYSRPLPSAEVERFTEDARHVRPLVPIVPRRLA